MLARPFRLVKEADFAQVLRKGRRYKVAQGQFKILPNGLGKNRFGIIVSNKSVRQASQRNLLKRRVREILRKINPSLKLGFDIVFIAYPPVLEINFAALEVVVIRSLTALGLLGRPLK